MDGLVIAFVALQAVLLAIAIGVILARNRELDAIRDATGAPDAPAEDLPSQIRHLRERLVASEFELDQQVRNASYLADLMGVGILRVGDDRRVELANAAAHVLLARSPGSMLGRTPLELFVDARADELVEAAADAGSASGEFRFRGADGPTLVVRARRSPVRGLWIVLEDVSELRRLQQIRAEFIDNLSHELRTPLSTVSLLAETLSRDAEAAGDGVPARMRDRIAKVEIETGHLVQMVNELLDLARIESGGSIVLLDDVDLGRLAIESVERLRLFAERQGVRLTAVTPEARERSGPFGGSEPVPVVRGDEHRIGQVLVNLIHNAVKFSDDGDEVVVRVRVDGDEAVVAVEDQGIGIPTADQVRIFERFYKVDRARTRGAGTGLGLSIARNVVGQHGGRIWVESEEGSGSTFTFALPLTAALEASH